MSEEGPPSLSGRDFAKGALWCFLVVVLLFFFLMLIPSQGIWLFEFGYHLFAGWVLHATRGISHIAGNLPALVSATILPCTAALVALWGFHRLVLWWRLANGMDTRWRFKHTALAGVLVLLGSAAAIALSGVLHEAAWLPGGKVIESNRPIIRTMAISNARTLGLYLFEYETEYGVFPSSLLDLQKLDVGKWEIRRLAFVQMDSPAPPEPFVLVNPGGTTADPGEFVLLGPQIPERGDFVVLTRVNLATTLAPAKFVEVVTSAARDNQTKGHK